MSATQFRGIWSAFLAVAVAVALPAAALSQSDDIAPPDIFRESFDSFMSGADNNMEMKIRADMYVTAIDTELELMKAAVEKKLAKAPELLDQFRQGHQAFRTFLEKWTGFSEDTMWFDLETGERFHGTGYGYTAWGVSAAMLWNQLICYREFLGSGDTGAFASGPLYTAGKIGGPSAPSLRELPQQLQDQ